MVIFQDEHFLDRINMGLLDYSFKIKLIFFDYYIYARLNWVKSNKPGWSRHWHKVTNIFKFPKNTEERREMWERRDMREMREERYERGEIGEMREERYERYERGEIWEMRYERREIWEMREERYERWDMREEREERYEKEKKHCTYKISWIFFTKYCTFRERITFSYERKQMDNQKHFIRMTSDLVSCHLNIQ